MYLLEVGNHSLAAKQFREAIKLDKDCKEVGGGVSSSSSYPACIIYHSHMKHSTSKEEGFDAEILADVYLLMTGGQVTLGLGEEIERAGIVNSSVQLAIDRSALKVIRANEEELREHEAKLDEIDRVSEFGSLWRLDSDLQ